MNKEQQKNILEIISKLKICSESMLEVANGLTKFFDRYAIPVDIKPPSFNEGALAQIPLPLESTSITLEDLRKKLVDKSAAGCTEKVRELLAKYGVSKLSELDPANYAAVFTEAEAM